MTMRIALATLALLLTSLMLPACDTGTTEETPVGTEGSGHPAAADAADAGATPDALGAALADGTALTSVADLLAKPEAMLGKTVRIQGQAVSRCGSGCSMTLTDGDAKLKVRANKEDFEFPAGWKDKTVVVEGTFEVDPGCAAIHAAAEKAEAEKAGGEASAEAPHKGEHQHHAEELGEQAEMTYTIQVSGAKIAG
jgi:hypothetical protein